MRLTGLGFSLAWPPVALPWKAWCQLKLDLGGTGRSMMMVVAVMTVMPVVGVRLVVRMVTAERTGIELMNASREPFFRPLSPALLAPLSIERLRSKTG